MIIKFIQGGKTSNIVEYVLKNSTSKNKILLSGSGELTSKIIDNSNYKKENYLHITLNENGQKGITTNHWKVILKIFKEEFYKGYDSEEYNILAVLHDNEHIHIVAPKINLESGTDLQLYIDKFDRNRINLIRDLIHNIDWTTHGLPELTLKNPTEIENDFINDKTRINEIIEFKTKYEDSNFNNLDSKNVQNAKDKKEFIKIIQATIFNLKKDGFLKNPKEVLELISKNFEVKKVGFDTKFQNKGNEAGYYAAIELNNKIIRVPVKELNNGQFKENNINKSNEQLSTKSGNIEKIRSALDKENNIRIKKIEGRKGKIQKIKNIEFYSNDDNNTNFDIRDRLENDRNKSISSISTSKSIKPIEKLQGVEYGNISGNIVAAGTKQKTIKEKIIQSKIKEDDLVQIVDIIEFEENLNDKKYNNIKGINMSQQEQINLKDRIPNLKKNINMMEYLENQGIAMISKSHNNYLCKSPLREDKNPSFGVFYDNNKDCWMFYDFATLDFGTIIDLHMQLNEKTLNETISDLSEMALSPILSNVVAKPKRDHQGKLIAPKFEDKEIIIKDIFDYRLKNYLKDRKILKIPTTIKEMNKNQFYNGKIGKFTYLAFKNDSDGYILRNKDFKGNDGALNVTTINNNKDTTIVVEGLFDYLSLYQKYGDSCNYISMNSIANFNKLELKSEQKYIFGLNNDKPGIDTTLKVIEKFKGHNINIMIPKGKDFNEDLLNDHNMEYIQMNKDDYINKCSKNSNINIVKSHKSEINR